jgi:hypothetical protein
MKGLETIWRTMTTRKNGLYKEDNVNMLGLYIQDNTVISLVESYGYLIA